ncbi:hypothetical protein CBR_g56901, partial [Chara braunii]
RCKVFSKINLKFGYHQIEVDPADQHKIVFKTHDGLYEFTPGHFARDYPQPKRNQPPPVAAPVALNQGRVTALMDTAQGRELVAYEQPSLLTAIASTSGSSSSDADDVVDPLEYLHLAGMIGAIRSAPDDLEWVDRDSNLGPQFRTGEIDVLRTLKQLDIRVPILVGYLLTISEAAKDKLLQQCLKNQKSFTYQRVQRMLKKKEEEKEDVAPPEPETGEPEAAHIAAIFLAEKDHFVRARPVLWKSAECDCEVWGKPFNALIDTGASAVAISLDIVRKTGRPGSILPQSGKDNYVFADEKAMNIVGIIENVAVKVGRVHVLVNALVIDWIRCPMGICNAPATFQRAMNMVFQNFVRKTRLAQSIINYCVIVYMDDILVYSSSYEGHMQHIERALHALRDAGFKVALEKCQFFLTTISFLGHVVTDKGLQPEPQKVAAVRDALVPTTITQVRAFLGLASYFRRFIKGFAAIPEPLTNLLQKDQPLIWTPECDQAFSKLKAVLISAPVLIRPNPEKSFILITDWQREAISAILAQAGPSGLESVVEYASKSVSTCKRNYAAPTGECYAALWGISHFCAYLYGGKFTLVTDHEPLLALKKSKDYSGMIGRWATVLQSMDFDIRHRKHERHGNADRLTYLHRKDEDTLPSRQEYLKPYNIIPHAFYPKAEEVVIDDDEDDDEEDDDEETSEEGSYSEYSEGELSEEEEEEEETGSEWEALPEEAAHTGTEREDPEVVHRQEDITAGKRQLEFASRASQCIGTNPTRDPEPPKPEDGDPAAATPSTSRRRRSRSPSSSNPIRPPVRPRTDAGDRPPSSNVIPPSP